jgi:hypothetical protein
MSNLVFNNNKDNTQCWSLSLSLHPFCFWSVPYQSIKEYSLFIYLSFLNLPNQTVPDLRWFLQCLDLRPTRVIEY